MNWAGGAALGLLIVGILIGLLISRQRVPTQAEASHADKLDYPSETDHKTSIAALARAHIAFTKDKATADKDTSSRETKSYRVNLGTFIGVSAYTVITLIIMIITIIQFGSTQRFNKKQLRAMTEQIVSMQGQSEEMHKTLVLSYRPWLYIPGEFHATSSVTFSAEVNNSGNSVAVHVSTNVEIGGIMTPTTIIEYQRIKCGGVPPSQSFDQPISIWPKQPPQALKFYIDTQGRSLAAYGPNGHVGPILLGCIEYRWAGGDDIFHTYFEIPIDIFDKTTGYIVSTGPGFPKMPPSDDIVIRVRGGITYLHVD